MSDQTRMTKERLDEIDKYHDDKIGMLVGYGIRELIAEIRACWNQIGNMKAHADNLFKCAWEQQKILDAKPETTSLDDEAIELIYRLACSNCSLTPNAILITEDCYELKDYIRNAVKLYPCLKAARRVPALKWQKEKPTEPCWCVVEMVDCNGIYNYPLFRPSSFHLLSLPTDVKRFLPIPAPTEETVGGFQTPEQVVKAEAPQPAEVEFDTRLIPVVENKGAIKFLCDNGGIICLSLPDLIACIDEWKRRNNA